jgi:YegS/Rv2252/BmrU family lipid kinase
VRRAGLIINPKAGRGASVDTRLDEMIRVLSKYGFETDIRRTTPEPDSARDLAIRTRESCDTVIACGGDGTVHGVLQGIAGTSTRLGVIPFGTANALARNLSLPADPVLALDRLLSFTAKQIPLGKAVTSTSTRWFTVMAGAGPDGTLVQEMKLAAKARVGRSAYYTEAARLFLTRRFPQFRVEYRLLGSNIWENRLAVGMMASRIQNLGGLFSGLTSHSRLHHPHLLVQLLAAPAHLAFPAWMAFGKVGFGKANPWLTTLEVEELRCVPLQEERQVFAQVDGEAVGALPMNIQIVPSSLHLLMP